MWSMWWDCIDRSYSPVHPGPCLQWVKSCQECIECIPCYSLPVTLQWHNKCTLCLAAESFKSDIFTSEPVPGVSIFSFGHWNVLIFLQILFSYHFQISSLCHFIQIENHIPRNILRSTYFSIKIIYLDI